MVHKLSTSSMRSQKSDSSKLTLSKQRSLPSDVTTTEVGGEVNDKTSGEPIPSEKAKYEIEEDSRSVSSVVSEVLPEGQDEQAGCSIS